MIPLGLHLTQTKTVDSSVFELLFLFSFGRIFFLPDGPGGGGEIVPIHRIIFVLSAVQRDQRNISGMTHRGSPEDETVLVGQTMYPLIGVLARGYEDRNARYRIRFL